MIWGYPYFWKHPYGIYVGIPLAQLAYESQAYATQGFAYASLL